MIKYRVYDTRAKKYLNINNVSISGSGILRVVTYEDGYHTGISQLPNDNSPRFIIEQYTGLEDKNGTEIAVGDIVAGSGDKGEVVVMRYGAFEPVSYYQDEIMTIIGNIHENAELLEAEDE